MGVFFGTDGLRGIANEDLTFELAYKCGNALTSIKKNPTVLIGRDTRVTGEYFTLAVAGGVISGGGSTVDLGVIPTAGVAYLVREMRADYGVVISASHNPREYNGIKIFGSDGYKLSDREEELIERCFIHSHVNEFPEIGRYSCAPALSDKYLEFLLSASRVSLSGIRIVIDGANGAAHRIAPEVFSRLGAEVIPLSCEADGMRINDGCGALYPGRLAERVREVRADVGFSFDGDADRLIAADGDGRIIDGDMIIYMLAQDFKERRRLRGECVVGTSHTNMAIEDALMRDGISFVRTDIGDKYVMMKMLEMDAVLGGEQSGHVIIRDLHTTGDGILTAIELSNIIVERRASLSSLFGIELYEQTNLNVVVEDKLRVVNSQLVSMKLSELKHRIAGEGRIMLRASGTEPKIRIMVESRDEQRNEKYAEELADAVREADNAL